MGGFLSFSDLECPSGVRHRNSADSAKIGGFWFLAAVRNRVYVRCRRGAENEICANFSLIFAEDAHFRKFVWHGRFRTIFLHKMINSEKFSDAPVFCLRQIWPNMFFLLFPLFLVLLAAYLHDGWCRGCTRTTKNRQRPINDSNDWSFSFCVFYLVNIQRSCFMFYTFIALYSCFFPPLSSS